ncbi:retrovirus-related pol polyprotein from transposon RE1 [Citrus sinensis]|uniref:Retrovirus-related pol polyprotein from transposon RE1 n=1 Tax=Citrus sinensis TaxID=2711 RepID=A0ACB8K8F1_CITSI|nr:retrovirus-related pol polyprotein from transposon RE1 [Citrus sinensis]
MQEEFNALIRNQTWCLVPPEQNMKLVGKKWIYRVKQNSDGSINKYKARLVAKGFLQTEGIDYQETFSLVVKAATIRIVLSLAVMNNWKLRQVDINNAFLNGELSETVYMPQPEGFENSEHPNYVCKLKKALYGLNQAPRAWFEKLRSVLESWQFTRTRSDTSLFFKRSGNDMILLLIYVDDIIVTRNNNAEIEQLISNLSSTFALKDLGNLNFFLGIEVIRNDETLVLSQSKYIKDLLAKFDLRDCKGTDTPLATTEKLSKNMGEVITDATQYRKAIGGLQYAVLTRPEIAYAVNKLSQFMANPLQPHWIACKRVLRYLKETIDYGLTFRRSDFVDLVIYTDADWGSDIDDRRSTSDYCVYLELDVRLQNTPLLLSDSTSAAAIATNPVMHSKTKHIEINIHFVRDKVERKEVEIAFVSTNDQVADILTKPLTYPKFSFFRSKLKVFPKDLSLRRGVELVDEAEPHATHIGVPVGIKPAVNLVASLGVRVKDAREELKNSRWQNCYEEIPMQLDVAGIS